MLAVWRNLSKVLIIMACHALVHPCCLYRDLTTSCASVPCSGHDDATQHHLHCLLQSCMTLLPVGTREEGHSTREE